MRHLHFRLKPEEGGGGGASEPAEGAGFFLISALNHLDRLLHIWSLGRWAGKDPAWLREGGGTEEEVGRCEAEPRRQEPKATEGLENHGKK